MGGHWGDTGGGGGQGFGDTGDREGGDGVFGSGGKTGGVMTKDKGLGEGGDRDLGTLGTGKVGARHGAGGHWGGN